MDHSANVGSLLWSGLPITDQGSLRAMMPSKDNPTSVSSLHSKLWYPYNKCLLTACDYAFTKEMSRYIPKQC